MCKYIFVALLIPLVFAPLAAGQLEGGDFAISSSTIDNGGGISTGGDFELACTIGQSDASRQVLFGGEFQLVGGFWSQLLDSELIFEDSFE